VLVTGGYNVAGLNGSELYDPSTGNWIVTYSMNHDRREHTESLLTNGKVLVTGGVDGSSAGCTNSSELY
jgi:hypothetical protein